MLSGPVWSMFVHSCLSDVYVKVEFLKGVFGRVNSSEKIGFLHSNV